MGLDMYLFKKTYVKNWDFQSDKEKHLVEVKKGDKIHPTINPEKVSEITEEVMYWRKANQIHGWFCNNCRTVIEDVEYDVSIEDLKQLLADCKEVLELLYKSKKTIKQVVGGWSGGKETFIDIEVYEDTDKIMEILPPTEGFFFGSLEIDFYYRKDIEETIQGLEKELAYCYDDISVTYSYYASW